MKKKIAIMAIGLFTMLFSGIVYAGNVSDVQVYFNGELIEFSEPPRVDEGCTIVPVRALSEKAGFEIEWDGDEQRVEAFSENINVSLYIGISDVFVEKEGREICLKSILPPQIINSVTYVPLRTVSEAFGAEVVWNGNTNSIYVNTDGKSYDFTEIQDTAVNAESSFGGNTFYSQYDKTYIENYSGEPYGWTAGRNGYCYVTSYAMLLSDITGTAVTPIEIADINIAAGGSPKSCYHGAIMNKYGRKLVPALDSSSAYYKSYDSGRGLTYIDNSTEENVISAIKEALARNPEGVMVRDLSMPHTMVVVGCEGDTVYFNDPALQEGGATWSETCLKKRTITTIVAIMAID